jgi:hypothetical protein
MGLAAALVLTGSAAGCDWIRSITLGEFMQLVHKSSRLTLAWDPPLSDIPNRPSEVASYQIFCREHGSFYWRFLGEVQASPNPEYTVEHGQLGDGLFDFAVRAVTVSGQASALHTSLDSSADPVSGWYVLWAQSN